MALVSHCVCLVSIHKRKLFSGAVPAALQVLAGLPGCPQQSSAGSRSAQWGLAGGGFGFPSLKGCGELNKLLCCNSIAACSNQEWVVSS